MNNLLHISPNQFGSIETSGHTAKIWEELSNGFDNYYVFARSKHNKFEKYQKGKVNLILIPKIINKSTIFIFTSFLLLFYIKRLKITHILCQSVIFGGPACLLAKKTFKIPVMIEIHGEEYFRILDSKRFSVKLIGKLLINIYKTADKVRSLNGYMTEKLKQHGVNQNVIEIYNRVNLDLFNEIKEDYKIEGQAIKLVSVGRFVKEKNYENLIRYLSNSNFKYHLTLIGGGELKSNYIDLIKDLNQHRNITLIDWIEQKEMITTLLESDLYIQSSISEGMPRTIVEAMALQMPIISTNVGSIRGVIENEINGLLVEPNEMSIISAIKKMIELESLRESLARQGRNDVIEKYEWNSVFNKYRNEIITM